MQRPVRLQAARALRPCVVCAEPSVDLCDFLRLPRGSAVPMSAFCELLCAGTRDQADPEHPGMFVADDALARLLGCPVGHRASFFSMTQYLLRQRHYRRAPHWKPIANAKPRSERRGGAPEP